MPTVLQHRRGTAAQNNSFTGSAGELTVDLTNGTIRVHDGSTAGGKRLATKDSADAALAAAQGLDSANIIAIIDSAYVLARAPAQDFLDSSEAINLIDSSYVQARQTAQNFAYSSLTGAPTIPTLGTSFVDSSEARKVISVTDAGGDGSLSYNNSTGVLTYTGPSASDTRAHFTAGEGIDISSGEISGEDATTTNKGIASFSTSNFTVSSGAVSLKTDGINDTHIDFGTGSNQVSTADVPEQTNLYFTNARAKSAAVADAINNGTTDVAPSQNAVFDALALKLDASSVPVLYTDFIDSAEAIKLIPTLGTDFVDSGQVTAIIDSSYVQARQSGGEITIQEEGSSLSTAATTLNFVGSGVTASGSGTTKTITITGGGSGTVDSAAVIALMDSASRHTFGLVSVTNDASNGQSGQAQVQADTTRDLLNLVGGPGLAITTNASQDRITFTPVNQFDSAETIALIDSAYVLARAPAQTTADFPDSSGVNSLIDTRVNNTFINNLTIGADSLGGQAPSYYLNYNNFSNTPTLPSIGNDFVDSAFVTAQINNLIDAAPGALNTLNELAAAIGDDANFSTTVTNSIAAKLDSAQTIALIDSAYVLARAPAQDFLDSAEAIALIDSSYVQARQSATGGTDPIFKTIAVAGQSNIVADTTTDTLTVVGSTGITVTTNAGTDTLTFATTDGDIVHDNLSGFVANEHIDHTSVSIATGDGLSGGGTIASTRTLKIDSSDLASLYSKVIAHDNTSGFVANEHIDHTSVSIATGTGLSGGGTIASTRTLKIDSSDLAGLYSKVISHDNTDGFVANEHIDHTSVSIVAGKGLSGGGTIASSRTIDIDSANVRGMFSGGTGITYNSSTGAISTTDGDIVHDNLSGFVANEHIDHSGVSIIAGNGLSGGGTIASSRTINVDSANVDKMIDSNLGGSSVLIDGNGSTGGITLSDGNIDIRTGTGSVSKIKFYCETNNAHAQTLQAQPHSAGSSAVIVLPVASGTLLNDDGSGASLTNLNASNISSGTIDSARLPSFSASDTITGTFDSARIPAIQINANRITAGTIDSARLPAGTFGGGGGGSSLTIQEEGSSLSTAATTLNFVGSAVTASGTGATKTITITGGGGGLDSALTTQLIDSSYVSARALGGLGQNEFIYTATNNQTTFSGNDKKGNSLSYTADRIFVHLNGVLLNDSDDYTATNGTSVVLTTGATTSDELRVTAFGTATPPVTTGKAIAMAIVFGG